MRFLIMYTPDASTANTPPTAERMATMEKYVDEMTNSGVLLSTGGLLPLSQGALLKSSGGKFTLKDGPYAEAKEVVAGYAIIQANSLADAIEHSKSFLKIAGDGENEIRVMMDGPSETA